MKTPEFWRRISHVVPELLLDASALGKSLELELDFTDRRRRRSLAGLCEDSVLFCQNYDVQRLTALVKGNPLLFKVIAQVTKEWTLSTNQTSQDVRLSPGTISFVFERSWINFASSCLFSQW